MKIAFTGTRGIPNRYGGFEQFAEQLSLKLAARGHEVWVYNPAYHPLKDNHYQGVKIIRKPHPERILGPASNFLYDYHCIKDAVRQKADIIFECGYASAAPSYLLLNFRNTRIITHMDGLEWSRTKWSAITRRIIKKTEKTAVRISHALVCDHPEIETYLKQKFGINPFFIPYGADVFQNPDASIINRYGIAPGEYYLTIARLEPENNLYTIIRGFLESGSEKKLLVVGDLNTGCGRKLFRRFGKSMNIIFMHNIFNKIILDNLRHFSTAYLHGHSAGGTNPSLLEAMAAGAFIIAHDNKFNRYILKDNAWYFQDSDDIKSIFLNEDSLKNDKTKKIKVNILTIDKNYRWEKVTDEYEELFRNVLNNKGK